MRPRSLRRRRNVKCLDVTRFPPSQVRSRSAAARAVVLPEAERQKLIEGSTRSASYTCQLFLNGLISMIVTGKSLRFSRMDGICSFEHERAK
jgi:hypothetical protein